MRLDFVLIADAATAAEGKLYVHGGGITRLTPPMFPWAQQLSFCFRVLIDESDLGRDHRVAIAMRDPDGNQILAPQDYPIPPPEPEKWAEGEEPAALITLHTRASCSLDRGHTSSTLCSTANL